MVSAKPVDQIGGCAFGDQLAVINDGQPIAKALGLVHVMGCKQYCAAISLKGANDIPELTPALRIEAGRRLVEKKNSRISHERRSDGQALALPAGQLSYPCVGFFVELEVGQYIV